MNRERQSAVTGLDAGETLMDHTHRMYELEAVLNVLDEGLGSIERSREEGRRDHALTGLALRLAAEAVETCDALMEAEIEWKPAPQLPPAVAEKTKAKPTAKKKGARR